ncbi:hypothetical protein [Gimesia sp.]|uniref:hypothetical protein n=1 Tax=Gimesia sp. TaxID=2024833 RepID=UPI0025B904D9|nr:hypothetical protein [Gimesia sp.]
MNHLWGSTVDFSNSCCSCLWLPLPPETIAHFKPWIDEGAPWPADKYALRVDQSVAALLLARWRQCTGQRDHDQSVPRSVR